jgi:hypothetical protein
MTNGLRNHPSRTDWRKFWWALLAIWVVLMSLAALLHSI